MLELAQTPTIRVTIKEAFASVNMATRNADSRSTALLVHHKQRLAAIPKPAKVTPKALAERQREMQDLTAAQSIVDSRSSQKEGSWDNLAALAATWGELDEHLRRTTPNIAQCYDHIVIMTKSSLDSLKKLTTWSSTEVSTQKCGDEIGVILSDFFALTEETEASELSDFLLLDYSDDVPSYVALSSSLETSAKEGLPEQNPFTSAIRLSEGGGLRYIPGTDARRRPRRSFRPVDATSVKKLLQAIFAGPRGGDRITWEKISTLVISAAQREADDLRRLPKLLDTMREHLGEKLLSVFFPQYFGRRFLEKSDEAIANFNQARAAEKEQQKY